MVQVFQEPIFVELVIMFLKQEHGEIELLNQTILHHQIQDQQKFGTKKLDFQK